MSLPKDPIMLLSYVNTQLRDTYSNLDDLCKSLNIDKAELINKMLSLDYVYDDVNNKFI